MTTLAIEHGGLGLVLHGAGVAHCPDLDTLIVADLHFGKAETFRRAGVAVPEATTSATLARLDAVLETTAARRLVVLGDFFHGRAGRDGDADAGISAWRRGRPALEIVLVRGNHDRHAGDPPPAWSIECVAEPWRDGPFAWCHDPAVAPGDVAALAGHVHPAVTLHGERGGRLRCPCFHLCAQWNVLVFPAFGAFTGAAKIRPREGDRVFVVGDERVVEVNGVGPRRRATR